MEHTCGDAMRTSLHGQVILHISIEDVLVTKELRQAGTIFDIELLDSLIVLPSNYVSLRERGLGFDKP